MSKTQESGYARNLGNFKQLLGFCRSYGAAYNPSKPNLSVTKLEQVYQLALHSLEDADSAKNHLDQATNERVRAFSDLQQLSTRVLNAFSICGADLLAVEDVKGHNRKIQGQRAGKPPVAIAATGTDGEAGTVHHTRSARQTSYDFQLEHLSKLIQAVGQEPAYHPNEEALSPSGLQAKLDAMRSANDAYLEAYIKCSNARVRRNFVFNNPPTGLALIAADVKKYIKATFGSRSTQSDQVLGLAIKKR